MFKRKRKNKRKLRLKLRKPADRTAVFASQDPGGKTAWVIKVTGEQKAPQDIDAKAIADALLEAAADQLIKEAEQELANLKGDRTKQATAKRKELKQKIDSLHVYQRRLYGLSGTRSDDYDAR